MATTSMVYDGLIAALTDATAGLTPEVEYFKDVPTGQQLSNLSRPGGNNGKSLVWVFDLTPSRNTTRWPVFNLSETIMPTNLVSTLSSNQLNPTDHITMTLTETPNLNDSVSFVAQNGIVTKFDVVTAVADDTDATIATKMAAKINADASMNLWVSASATGNVVTITNNSDLPLSVYSKTGNQATRTQAIMNLTRNILICAQTRIYRDRMILGDMILQRIGQLQAQTGGVGRQYLQLADSTWMRVLHSHDRPGRVDHTTNTYRYDVMVEVEYTVTSTDYLYQVLAIDPTITLQ